MKSNYFLRLFLYALILNPFAYIFSKNSLPVKKSSGENYYVSSVTDPDWSYTCQDGIEVELLAQGLKCSVPSTITLSDTETIQRIVVEIVYKTENPGETIQISDAEGNLYTADRVRLASNYDVWYYRTEIPATASINYSVKDKADYAQSMLAYVFRYKNTGYGSSGYFTYAHGYNNIVDLKVPINTDTGPRTVKLELPVTELTNDGRYIHIEAAAGAGSFAELTDVVTSFPSGDCCIKIYELTLENVAGDVSEVSISIDTRNKENGQTCNGQSWVLASSVKTEVHCSCVDFDTTPPTADNLVDRRILEDISQMPKVTFSDECSAVTIEYNEYEPVEESCWLGIGVENTNSNIWFDGFPFDKNHHWANGYLEQFPDATAKLHGRVVNNSDPTSGWIIDVYFESLVDYTTWIASGGITTNDPQRTERLYGAVDFSKPYLLQGFGDYTGADLSLIENSDHQYMDLGPHADSYGDYGMGLCVAYQGTVNGQTVNEGTIEGAASLTKCVRIRGRLILREWKVTDAAGNTNVFIQRVELEE